MRSQSFDELLEAYRKVWKNRLLETDGSTSEEILKETVLYELLDGNSHPRVRKSKTEKYLSATKRIIESELTNDEKVALVQIHIDMIERGVE
ncbi:hypothetical protein LS684_23900 (plasmid) [Cytobacillus spongiae]|uniref:hypothetical protein n=1 Tax=Cytobacillus spongiae TaxID=2901381 RepID=UPI00145F9D58|nr:hypothetical protein [Cytobacillus spongiae]MCA1063039.1 hypothetical protein [Rossellomorea aquimaris]NMH70371.1 hypothetical protein [Bacillus sp. RO3]UII58632.1 hypothetical protein LS684_23900 [Cytobacillus spongiae]WJV28341.1 hypothetical protein QTG56_14665 [Rossellomorea sp. AcN35-11]